MELTTHFQAREPWTVGIAMPALNGWESYESANSCAPAIGHLLETGAALVELVLDEHAASADRLLRARPLLVPALESAGASPHSLTTDLFWRYNTATQSADRRGQALRVMRTLCRVAADYQISTVVVSPGMQEVRTPYDATYAAALQTLQISARYALESGVTIAIENVPTSFLQSPREFSGLLRDVGSPAVRACINVNNVIAAGQVYPENWILALSDYLILVHAHVDEDAHGPAPPAGRSVDWGSCLDALRDVRYQGPIILGLPPPGLCAHGSSPPPRTAVISSVQRITNLCRSYSSD